MKFLRIQPLNNSAQWFTELRKAFEKEDLTLYELPDSLLNGPVTFAGKGSLSGIQMEVQADNLRLYDLSYPSDFDQKVYKAVASHFLNLSYKLWREEVELDNVEVFCRDDEPEFLTRANRKISLLNLQAACLGKSKASRDAYMIERMHHLSVAKEVELYQVDGINSFIWDGEPV
ncbi:MAG: hypothetical protein MK132_12250 [Lentisphaerales bacterium]|nr:hypothetical protein [Lentisphaerales bacterium]